MTKAVPGVLVTMIVRGNFHMAFQRLKPGADDEMVVGHGLGERGDVVFHHQELFDAKKERRAICGGPYRDNLICDIIDQNRAIER